MPKVIVRDIEMYYEVHGEGTPLVMIMGWGGTLNEWDPELINQLKKKHKIILLDNRAIGKKTVPKDDFTIRTMADDTIELLDQLNIEKAHFYGISMGSAIGQQLLLNYPHRIKGLILASGAARIKPRIRSSSALEIAPLLMNPPDDMSEDEIQDKFLTLLYTEEYIKQNRERTKSMIKEFLSREPIRSKGRIMQWKAIQKSYPPVINTPTLIIHGDKDTFVPVENARILHSARAIIHSKK
jgi:pimeloyl-ACP methyl ester carboxylesterase